MDADSDDDLYQYFVVEEDEEVEADNFKSKSELELDYDNEKNFQVYDVEYWSEDMNQKFHKDITKDSSETFVGERLKESAKTDLFQQPFVLKYLETHPSANSQKEHDDFILEDENESFVDPKSVCRLCMRTDQNIFSRLFYTNKTLTPIATKLASLIGKDKVEEDLLPQQICLECSETVNTCYTSVKHFSESYQVLSEVVDEIKKKSLVFPMPGSTCSLQLKIHDKFYEFFQCPNTTIAEKSKKKSNLDQTLRIKCYVCKQNFSPEALKGHMADEHDCHIEYKCKRCDVPFPTLHFLNKHDCSNADVADILPGYIHVECDDVHSVNGPVISKFQKPWMNSHKKQREKRECILELCDEAASYGTVHCQSCKYCPRVFKATLLDDNIKAHIASHVNDVENIHHVDPLNIELSQHLSSVSCYICKFCQMPKPTLTKLRQHLNSYCNAFLAKYRYKTRDRKQCKPGKGNRKPLMCKTCGDNIVYTSREYTAHVKENHPELVYKCASCPRSFIRMFALLCHNKSIHLKANHEKQSFLCEYCSRECTSLSGYKNHIKSHLETTKAKCKRLNKNREIKKHIKKKTYKNVERLTCPICKLSQKFKNGQAGLDFHMMKHEREISCCNRKFTNYGHYTKHISSHSRSWSCQACDSSFESRSLLRDHTSSTHSICPDCSHVPANFIEFMKHRQKCTAVDNQFKKINRTLTNNRSFTKTYICDLCNILFGTKHDLFTHKTQNHWDDLKRGTKYDLPEPVLCCGKEFTRKYYLKAHTAKHQDSVCKTCGDVLKSKLALQNHNATHHRQDVQCKFCEKNFVSTQTLRYHMLKHTRGRVFKCPCGLSFYTAGDCRRHQRNRKSPCIGSMIQQAIGKRNPDDTEDIDYDIS